MQLKRLCIASRSSFALPSRNREKLPQEQAANVCFDDDLALFDCFRRS